MPHIPHAPQLGDRLDSWPALRVSDTDAESFLQGQLSADLRAIAAGSTGWASYNSPKGRMLAVMLVSRADSAFELRMSRRLIEPIAKRLRMFVMRAKVAIESAAAPQFDAALEWRERAVLIESGIPVVYPETQDRWVPQMANLDLIGGVGFDKGCYTGQEVIARLHYLGHVKRRMFRVSGNGPAPAPGTSVYNTAGDAQAVGDIVDAVAEGADFIASAVLQLAMADSDSLKLDRSQQSQLSRPQRYVHS